MTYGESYLQMNPIFSHVELFWEIFIGYCQRGTNAIEHFDFQCEIFGEVFLAVSGFLDKPIG